jgi:hypothetical protein
MDKKGWFFVLFAIAAIIVAFSFPRLAQNPADNIYADQRTFFGIPNFVDVISNLPFLIVGIMGLCNKRCRGYRRVFFWAIIAVSFGSGFYHLDSDNLRLFWDRFPMIVALTALFAIVAQERISSSVVRWLGPLVIIGGATALLYWIVTQMNGDGDLRPYLLFEYFPVLTIPLLCLFYPHKSDRYFYTGILFYVAATVGEGADLKIFDLTHEIISGHTLKHILAALGAYCIYREMIGPHNKQ